MWERKGLVCFAVDRPMGYFIVAAVTEWFVFLGLKYFVLGKNNGSVAWKTVSPYTYTYLLIIR